MRPDPAPDLPGFRARWAALRNVAPFLGMVWQASPGLLVLSLVLRLARALIPVTALWFGKLIIDEVVRLAGSPLPPRARSAGSEPKARARSSCCSERSSCSPSCRIFSDGSAASPTRS